MHLLNLIRSANRKILVIYLIVSALLAIFTRPGYDRVSAWAILAGGPASYLSLTLSCLGDVISKDLSGEWHLSGELGLVILGALILWWLGAGLLCFSHRCRWSPECILSVVVLWVIAGFYCIFLFAIRSV